MNTSNRVTKAMLETAIARLNREFAALGRAYGKGDQDVSVNYNDTWELYKDVCGYRLMRSNGESATSYGTKSETFEKVQAKRRVLQTARAMLNEVKQG